MRPQLLPEPAKAPRSRSWQERLAAAAEAEAAGLQVVMNRCPKIEYGRLSGEIGWAGVNAGGISSKRPLLGGRGVQNHVIAGKR